jgi:hypothetical protein
VTGLGAPACKLVGLMQPGDTVKVRSSGRRARIVGQVGDDRFQVEYLPDVIEDPIDRDTVQSEVESGIYHASDLEPAN